MSEHLGSCLLTEQQRRVLDAAREWVTERSPRDKAEKALFAAVFRAYPDDMHTRESCDCGVDCDECPTAERAEEMIRQCEQEAVTYALSSKDGA